MNSLNEEDCIFVCPEVLGGLGIPRITSERKGNRSIQKNGEDVTSHFHLGAKKALEKCEGKKIDFVLLKAKSPSCGSGIIYDGSFSGKLIEGDGVFAEYCKDKRYLVIDEVEFVRRKEYYVSLISSGKY